MDGFWRNGMAGWCLAVAVFGLVLTGAAFPATEAPARILLGMMGGEPVAFDRPLRFAVALMGVVTFGWGLSLLVAARDLSASGWRRLTGVVALWWAVDCLLSIATGFWPNAASNTLFFAAFVLIVLRSGAIGPATAPTRPLRA